MVEGISTRLQHVSHIFLLGPGLFALSLFFSMTEPKTSRISTDPAQMALPTPNAVVKQEREDGRVVFQASQHAGGAGEAATQTNEQRKFMAEKSVTFVENKWLYCSACAGPLKPPLYKCAAAGHKVCCACSGSDADDTATAAGHCRACGGTTSSLLPCSVHDLYAFLPAHRVRCPYEVYGCRRHVPYDAADEHRRGCAHAPCSCSEPGCSFRGSPRALQEHLAAWHWWPVSTFVYGAALEFRVPPSERRRLLVAEGEVRVFVLAVGERGGGSDVSVMCLRAAAAAGPRYRYELWAVAPEDPEAGPVERVAVAANVRSRASPREGAVGEERRLNVLPDMLHGPSKEMLLHLIIHKIRSAHQATPPCSTTQSSAGVN